MSKVSKSIYFKAVPEKAWKVLTDLENYSNWVPEIKKRKIITKKQTGVSVVY
ncbi:MAG: SRPBCC family protein, partial [Fidelibacterota bacterium]